MKKLFKIVLVIASAFAISSFMFESRTEVVAAKQIGSEANNILFKDNNERVYKLQLSKGMDIVLGETYIIKIDNKWTTDTSDDTIIEIHKK